MTISLRNAHDRIQSRRYPNASPPPRSLPSRCPPLHTQFPPQTPSAGARHSAHSSHRTAFAFLPRAAHPPSPRRPPSPPVQVAHLLITRGGEAVATGQWHGAPNGTLLPSLDWDAAVLRLTPHSLSAASLKSRLRPGLPTLSQNAAAIGGGSKRKQLARRVPLRCTHRAASVGGRHMHRLLRCKQGSGERLARAAR